jgi:hypothetical protein
MMVSSIAYICSSSLVLTPFNSASRTSSMLVLHQKTLFPRNIPWSSTVTSDTISVFLSLKIYTHVSDPQWRTISICLTFVMNSFRTYWSPISRSVSPLDLWAIAAPTSTMYTVSCVLLVLQTFHRSQWSTHLFISHCDCSCRC